MQTKAEKMMKDYTPKINNNKFDETKPHFVLIPRKEASINKRQIEIDNAQSSIDFITSWKRFPRTVDTFGENTKKALEHKVKIRGILEKPENILDIPETIDKLKKFPNYHLRYILKRPKAIIVIFDKKRALIKTSATGGLAEKPSLWTDNPCLISVLSDYFEIMWITAIEKNIKNSEMAKPVLGPTS